MENRVVWREGLFIKPQHFQQNDRYFTYELAQRTSMSRENNWGFYNLQIDEHLLSTGKLLITKASGLLFDGTYFEINSENNSLILDIKSNYLNKVVYLALPINIKNSDEVYFEEQKNMQTRLKARTIENIPNINSGETSISDILIAEYNFRLLFEDDLDARFIYLPICKIADISLNGTISLDNDFLPTYLDIQVANKLYTQTKEILEIIGFRAEKLSQKVTDSVMKNTQIGDYLLLQLLNKYESRIHYLLTQNRIHPDKIFIDLVSLTSELAVFMKKEKRLLNQFNYNHNEQYESFKRLFDELKNMLTMVLEQNSISLQIEKRKYGIHIVPIQDKELIKNSYFIFSVSADISADKIKEILINGLKFGTVENIKNLVNYHLIGFKIKPLATAPKEIPYKVNHLYFKLELTEENLKELLKSAAFAFHLSTEIPNVEYALWAIKNN